MSLLNLAGRQHDVKDDQQKIMKHINVLSRAGYPVPRVPWVSSSRKARPHNLINLLGVIASLAIGADPEDMAFECITP
jgi:hypothetical protein